MKAFLHIFNNNIIPIFMLIGLGYLLSKRFKLDIGTLSKANFYLYVPIFVFTNVYSTNISSEMLKAFVFGVLVLITNMIIGSLISKGLGYSESKRAAFSNAIMFYNSGNVGIPLITLVFSSFPYIINGETPYLDIALSIQVAILIVQNVSTNTLGFFNAGRASLHWKESIKNIFKMPVIYTISLAFLLKLIPYDLTSTPIWIGLDYIKTGMISIALITLGVQLSKTKFNFADKDVYITTVTRLLGGPIIALILIKLMGLNGIVAQTLMISTSVPSAVNSALIAVEYDNEPEFASQVVLTATVFSAISLSMVIYFARILFPIV